MLNAAANQFLAGAELDAFHDLMEEFRNRYRERSKLVHNMWGHSDDHPDKALWWRAVDVGETVAKIAAASTIEEVTSLNRDGDEICLKAMTYTVKDLDEVAKRLREFTDRCETFIRSLIQSHPLVAVAIAATNAQQKGAQSQPQTPLQLPQTAP